MPGTPFESAEPAKRPLTTRLFKKPDKKNAIRAVRNLLANASSIRDVVDSDIEAVLQAHFVRSAATLESGFEELYAVYVRHCLEDRHLSDGELEDLQHLKHLFGLTDSTVNRIHEELASHLYHESVDEVIRDGRLDDTKRTFLKNLESSLRLPTELTERIYESAVEARLQRAVDHALEDERLSPEEDAEISAIATSLGAELQFDERTRQALDRFRLYWMIENGEVPSVPVDIKLQRSEQAYFVVGVNWYELRRVTKSYRYGGPTARIRIAKGIYWRMGQIGVQPISEDILTLIDSGYIYLTNKRLIFAGQKKNTTIRLQRILGYTPFKNGVEIQKDAGKSPFLEFSQDVDLFVLLLERAIRDLG